MCGQLDHHDLQGIKFLLQVSDLHILLGELLIQALDGGQRHAAFIHKANVFIIHAEAERGLEILGHRAEMFARLVLLEIPAGDRQRR